MRTLLAAVVLVFMPFPVILTLLSVHKGGYDFQAIVFPSDVALLALLVFSVADFVRDFRRAGAVMFAATALWLLLVIAFVVHPADRGFLNVLRLAGTIALAWVFMTTRDRAQRALLIGALAFTAASQSLLAFTQLVLRHDVGLGSLGEFPQPFNVFGKDLLAPQGTMVHIYLLAGLALLAGTVIAGHWLTAPRQRGWLVLGAACVAPVGVTYSRAALIGLALAILVFAITGLIRRQRGLWWVGLALAVGFAIPAAIWPGGWTARVTSTSVGRASLATVSTGRTELMGQAIDVIKDDPVFGVGPGRYVIALRDRGVDPEKSGGVWKPVHDVPLLVAAEGGVLAGLALVALLLLLGWHAWEAGPLAIAVYLAYLPYTLLDHFPFSFPQGLIMTGVWVGVIELLRRERGRPSAPPAGS